MKKIIVFILAMTTLYLLCLVPNIVDAIHLRFFAPPEYVLNRFYTEKDLGEDQLSDSLILAGSRMVPLLEKEVLNKRTPRRRYMIRALGMIANKNSTPIFEQILQDTTEKKEFRADALIAVALIDLTTAQQLASQYLNDKDGYVRYIAQKVLASDPAYLDERSYWEAFIHSHYP